MRPRIFGAAVHAQPMPELFSLPSVELSDQAGAPAVHWPDYGEVLVRAGKLTPRDLERALAAQR